MEVSENVDVRDGIMKWMKDNERNFIWLQAKTGINYHTLYSIIKLKHVKISDDKLAKINEVLGTDFKK